VLADEAPVAALAAGGAVSSMITACRGSDPADERAASERDGPMVISAAKAARIASKGEGVRMVET
jgi:hypothetical protein